MLSEEQPSNFLGTNQGEYLMGTSLDHRLTSDARDLTGPFCVASATVSSCTIVHSNSHYVEELMRSISGPRVLRTVSIGGVAIAAVALAAPSLASGASTLGAPLRVLVSSPLPRTTTTTSFGESSTTTSTLGATTTSTYPKVRGNTVPVAADPDAIIKVGGNIWVASCKGNELTVINDSTKQIVAEYGSNSNYQLDCPDALAFDKGYVWVANKSNSSLVQLNASTGAWIQTRTGSDILNPDAIAVTGPNIWVSDNIFLSEFNTTTGNNLHVTRSSLSTAFLEDATCLAVTGPNIWASDSAGAEAYEYNASSGVYLRETLGGGGGVSGAICVSYDNGYIWVTSENNSSVLEYNAATGVYIREVLGVDAPSQVIFTGDDLFVVDVVGRSTVNMVQEYSFSNRSLRTIVKANIGYFTHYGMAMLYDSRDLWVANPWSNTMTRYSVSH